MSLELETGVRMIALFDNEEVGSESANGAGSNLIENTIHRMVAATNSAANVCVPHPDRLWGRQICLKTRWRAVL